MIQKTIVAVALSLAAQFLAGVIVIASFGIIGKSDITVVERITGTFGQILFFAAPIAAAIYLAKARHEDKRTKKHNGKKALVAMLIGIAIVIGAFPAVLLGEVLSEKWASWRSDVYVKRLEKEDKEWRENQRDTVCVTKDTVSYDFEFGAVYNEYETAFYALRDKAPQSVRSQAANIIDTQINPLYESCASGQISPPTERTQLQEAFAEFIQLAEPYRD